MSNSTIWYHLYDSSTGLPYKGTSATFVWRSSLKVPIIAEFCKAVKTEYSDSHLKGVSPSDLLVFKNKDSFDKRNLEEEKVNHDMILDKGISVGSYFISQWSRKRKGNAHCCCTS